MEKQKADALAEITLKAIDEHLGDEMVDAIGFGILRGVYNADDGMKYMAVCRIVLGALLAKNLIVIKKRDV